MVEVKVWLRLDLDPQRTYSIRGDRRRSQYSHYSGWVLWKWYTEDPVGMQRMTKTGWVRGWLDEKATTEECNDEDILEIS